MNLRFVGEVLALHYLADVSQADALLLDSDPRVRFIWVNCFTSDNHIVVLHLWSRAISLFTTSMQNKTHQQNKIIFSYRDEGSHPPMPNKLSPLLMTFHNTSRELQNLVPLLI